MTSGKGNWIRCKRNKLIYVLYLKKRMEGVVVFNFNVTASFWSVIEKILWWKKRDDII